MRAITPLAAALLLITSSATGSQQSLPDRPNVILVMTDDAGYPVHDWTATIARWTDKDWLRGRATAIICNSGV
jgi:hypothetical protein